MEENKTITNSSDEDVDRQHEKIVDIINACHIHYKRIYKKKETEHMFSDLDSNNPLSTNMAMEFLYHHIHKYKENQKNNNKQNNLYNETDEFNLDEYDEFFALLINGDIIKLSGSLFNLLNFMVNEYDNWFEKKWEIMNLKNN